MMLRQSILPLEMAFLLKVWKYFMMASRHLHGIVLANIGIDTESSRIPVHAHVREGCNIHP